MAMIAIFSGCTDSVSLSCSTLRTLGHATAIRLHLRRHVVRADPALPVARHRPVDELRIRQVQAGHDLLELGLTLPGAEARVVALLLADRRDPALLVVVPRIDQVLVGEAEQLAGDAGI